MFSGAQSGIVFVDIIMTFVRLDVFHVFFRYITVDKGFISIFPNIFVFVFTSCLSHRSHLQGRLFTASCGRGYPGAITVLVQKTAGASV